MAIIPGRGGAPGTFIYEEGIASQSAAASFNTTYMLVEAPIDASETVFPFNRPIQITTLNEYENLIGSLPTSGGELTSYYSVKAFFQQVTGGDLRVTRVGTPSVISRVGFDPSANKDDGISAPSALAKGDKVYIKLKINDIELGEVSTSGAWLGVPVIMPNSYIPGDVSNNLAISKAIRDAVVVAIDANADISAGAYVRESSNAVGSEIAYFDVTGRIYNAPVSLVNNTTSVSGEFVLSGAGYQISSVSESQESIYDWIQCVRTAFTDPNAPQGYLCAPAAFTQYDKQDRVNLGQSMEEVCSDANHKWMSMVDCGPFYVTSILKYSDYLEHQAADGFSEDGQYLIDNVIYKWTDVDPLRFTSAGYDATNPAVSANPDLANGERRALRDDMTILINDGGDTSTEVFTLAENWPSSLASGTKVDLSLFINSPSPSAPLYNDTYTSAVSAQLIGDFYVIAADVDTSLDANEIKFATSRSRALGNLPVDLQTAGTAQGGGLLNVGYSTPSWEFEATIKGKTSNLIEVANGGAIASFNTNHLPGTLQDATTSHDFAGLTRQLTDPSQTIVRGGSYLRYYSSDNVTFADGTIRVVSHGLSTGDVLYIHNLPGGVIPAALDNDTTYYTIKVDANTIKLAASLSDANSGTAVVLADDGTDSSTVVNLGGGAAQGVLTQGSDAVIMCADHNLATAYQLHFDGDIDGTSSNVFAGTSSISSTVYFVEKLDRNFVRLARSTSDLASNVFVDRPSDGISTSTPVRMYTGLLAGVSGGTLSDSGLLRYLRGRKYQLDVTLAVFNVKDEAGVGIVTGEDNPYGGTYAADLATDFRLSASTTPEGGSFFNVAAADITNAANTITVTTHGLSTGDPVRIDTAVGAVLAGGLTDGQVYFAIVSDPDTIQLALTEAKAGSGTAVTIADDGTDNSGGVELILQLAASDYTFTYTEDESSNPLNNARDFSGDNNFYCVPLSSGQQANSAFVQVYAHPVLQTGTTHTTLYSGFVELEFVEPSSEVPNSLWNFDAVTSGDLVDEALRGTNNAGVPQMIVIETGQDSHGRLFNESQSYSTTQGFLAYYAPSLLNDVGVYVPPSGFVTGLALRRYRDEIAGFKLPPAGVKYNLAGARGAQVEITTAQQDVSNPYGLNACRQLPGYSTIDPDTGITYGPVFVWGARTRINPANATQALYKFVNTRVILNVIYGSLKQAFDGVIFDVIDGRAVTFNQIRTLASNILYSQFYVPGALFGANAGDAFDVICDDRNNLPANLDNGLVNCSIFVVPVPTLERLEIDLIRVNIGGISEAEANLGFGEQAG